MLFRSAAVAASAAAAAAASAAASAAAAFVVARFSLPLGSCGTSAASRVAVAGAWDGWASRLPLALKGGAFEGALAHSAVAAGAFAAGGFAAGGAADFNYVIDGEHWRLDEARDAPGGAHGARNHVIALEAPPEAAGVV